MSDTTDQKCLVFDIETSPILARVWGLKDQNIGLNQIVEDWSVLAWGAKWLNTPASDVIYADKRRMTEKALLQDIWKLLDQADIVITQNGKSFDSKRLNARFIHYGMKPPSPYRHIDTYLLVKQVADFTSNKLEYLTDKLCVKYKKTSHAKFPGMSLWNECLKGNKEAWEEMKKYNIHDVLSTEELFNKVKAWAPANTARVISDTSKCRMCGHTTQKRGMTPNKTKQRVVCTSPTCGAWGTVALPRPDKKEAV
jgi:DNA polymerase elongation subunit (family B)